ncbi:hypothetical protein AVEN_19128-1 [Araneus ventricosus]|uniref:Uncharacterized protein n=1 Tax=Araneus ventricosus TaxID=182803 RepID=A0A4Y2N9H4_ARAVE|nr:hypothetical protein AVEN_19128-1 [Araneus ventricosus]
MEIRYQSHWDPAMMGGYCWFLKREDLTPHKRKNLVILASRSEATRELCWDGSRNFEPRSDGDTELFKLPHHANGRTFGSLRMIAGNRPNTRRVSVESDFEHGALRPRSRDLTIRPPRPSLRFIDLFVSYQ